MKAIATVAAAAALFTLTACDRLGIGGGAASNQAGNAAGNASASAGKDAAAPAASGDKDPAGAVPAASTGAIALDRA